mmetsp:Transcript_24779/g.40348  ORF Transcript_24779/g.40348 Transcript_24779/m.40348 type:complete len:185 (-) Transcript_24779:838-1392(-)
MDARAILSKVIACLSVLGSLTIAREVLMDKKKRAMVYHRQMLALSLADVTFSIVVFVGACLKCSKIHALIEVDVNQHFFLLLFCRSKHRRRLGSEQSWVVQVQGLLLGHERDPHCDVQHRRLRVLLPPHLPPANGATDAQDPVYFALLSLPLGFWHGDGVPVLGSIRAWQQRVLDQQEPQGMRG